MQSYWLEIQKLLGPMNLQASDRLDIIFRVFKTKFEELLADLTKNMLWAKYLHVSFISIQYFIFIFLAFFNWKWNEFSY